MATNPNFGMGLLTNPFFAIGSGLLQSSGPSLTPTNPWSGVTQGLLAAEQAKRYQAQNEMDQMRMAALQRQQQQQAQRDAILAQYGPEAQAFPEAFGQSLFAEPATPNVSVFSADGAREMLVTPQQAAQLVGTGQWRTSEPGESWSQPKSMMIGGKEVLVQENAKTGQLRSVGGGGVTVNNMQPEKPLSTGELSRLRDSEGNPLPYGTTPSQAAGARIITAEEQAASTKEAQQRVLTEEAAGKGVDLVANYEAARKQYDKGWLPYGENDAQAKVARDALVTWYAKNVLGTPGAEPSPALYEKAEKLIPDYGGIVDASLYESRMKAVKDSITAAIGGAKNTGAQIPGAEAPPDVDQALWNEMTPEERAAWQ